MDRGLKNILWMSWTLRSRPLCLNYAIPNRITQAISQNYWSTHKDIYWSEKLEPVKRIMQESEIHSSKHSLRILNAINEKRPNMDLKDTMDILTALAKIAKEDKNKIHLTNHEGFKLLCEHMRKQIRVMSLVDAIESIKLLTCLNVPASTFLMQSLLQIVRNSVNDLHINQLHLLLCLLKKMEPTALSSALLIALPILLPTIINTNLNHEDLHELSLALYYLKEEEQDDLFAKICSTIQTIIKEKPKIASIESLKNIFLSLCFLSYQKYDSNIIFDTTEVVKEMIFHKALYLSIYDLVGCIHGISHSVTNGNMIPYNTALLNTLLETVMSKNVEFYLGCKILGYLNCMQYVYVPFIEYLLHKNIPENISNTNLTILLNALSNADYKAVPWTYLETKILNSMFLTNCSTRTLLKCTLHLAALDKYYPQILSTVFIRAQEKLLMLAENKNVDFTRMLCLYQSVKTLYPVYGGPWPPEKILTDISSASYVHNRSTLLNHLQIAMGGPQYVISNLRTKIGHNIDHAIIMRKGGYPVAYNKDSYNDLNRHNTYIEDIQCPPESYVILIIIFPRVAYSINTLRLLNVWKLQLKSLEKWTGHKSVDINLNEWNNLPDYEKIPYLMRKVRNDCDDVVLEM